MPDFPQKLKEKLNSRIAENALRELPEKQDLVDFTSNDYLGLAKNREVSEMTFQVLQDAKEVDLGATGSRLLSGNHILYSELETFLCRYYASETALVFNSGYNANLGLFASIPQRGDFVFYDELIHASIRDGIQMSQAKSYRFAHNDLNDLKKTIEINTRNDNITPEIYVVTESVFSMDGDSPDIEDFVDFCTLKRYHLVLDEAHAIGVLGKGLSEQLGLSDKMFARIVTFGKALGCHGAAVLGSAELKTYLINFARSLIYTTALPPHTIATILCAHQFLNSDNGQLASRMEELIKFFGTEVKRLQLTDYFIESISTIHCMLVPENEKVKRLAAALRKQGYDVKPILSPTVKKGEERLRICLHTYNTQEQITKVLEFIKQWME